VKTILLALSTTRQSPKTIEYALNEAQKEAIISQVPLKRIAEPVDIAKVVTFLL